jgi:hypothetical protein
VLDHKGVAPAVVLTCFWRISVKRISVKELELVLIGQSHRLLTGRAFVVPYTLEPCPRLVEQIAATRAGVREDDLR